MAGQRIILMHSCRNLGMLSMEGATCKCQKRISRKEADEYIAAGLAHYRQVERKSGKLTIDDRALIPFRNERLPKAPTIGMHHMERAYIDGKEYEQKRIEAYNEVTQDALVLLGARTRPRQATSPGRTFEPRSGDPMITAWGD